jgi:hypothetical protein
MFKHIQPQQLCHGGFFQGAGAGAAQPNWKLLIEGQGIQHP